MHKNKPFLKWAGNKFRVLDRILPLLPPGRRLIEPFAGSAAVFLNTDYRSCVLNDTNQDLIQLYRVLRAEGADFVRYASRWFSRENNTAERYYALRERFNNAVEPRLKSALFLYLNRHGYNGLCRYNATGQFNVPFGRYKRPYFPAQELLNFHRCSAHATFKCEHFLKVMNTARRGDVIYCDPPYVPLSKTANFTGYSAAGFGVAEQCDLAKAAERLAARGVAVLISNHDTGFTREVYKGAQLVAFDVKRTISCNPAKRAPAGEILALYA